MLTVLVTIRSINGGAGYNSVLARASPRSSSSDCLLQAEQLPELSKLSHQEVFTILLCHPVVNSRSSWRRGTSQDAIISRSLPR